MLPCTISRLGRNVSHPFSASLRVAAQMSGSISGERCLQIVLTDFCETSALKGLEDHSPTPICLSMATSPPGGNLPGQRPPRTGQRARPEPRVSSWPRTPSFVSRTPRLGANPYAGPTPHQRTIHRAYACPCRQQFCPWLRRTRFLRARRPKLILTQR